MAFDRDRLKQRLDTMYGPSGETDLRESLIEGMATDPDRAARALPLAEKNMIPLDMAERNLDTLEADEKFDSIDYNTLMLKNPLLADFLRDRENARLAHDDVGALMKVGDVARSLGSGFAGGVQYAMSGAGKGMQRVADYAAEGYVKGEQRGMNSPLDKLLAPAAIGTTALVGEGLDLAADGWEAIAKWIRPPDERRNLATDIGEGLGQVGMQITAATLSAPATVPLMVAQGLGYGFEQAEEAGKYGTMEGDATALLYAGITGLTEKYGLEFLMKGIPEPIKRGVVGAVARAAQKVGMKPDGMVADAVIKVADTTFRGATEATQEWTEGFLQNLVDIGVLKMDKSVWSGLPQQAAAGGGVGLIVGGLVNAMVKGKTSFEIEKEKIVASEMKQARETLNGSKLFARARQKVNDYLNAEMGGKDLYLNPTAVQTFYQSMPDDKKAMLNQSMPDFEKRLTEAVATEGDFVLNRADYMTYIQPMDEQAVLDNYVRYEPDDLSVGDRAEYDEFVKTLMESVDKQEKGVENPDLVQEFIYGQLVRKMGERGASGSPDIARLLSQNPRKFYEAVAAQTDYDQRAMNILNRLIRDVQINRVNPKVLQTARRDDFDLFIDAARTRSRQNRTNQERRSKPKTDLFGVREKRKKREPLFPGAKPVADYLIARGVRPDGSAAKYLAPLGLTPKTYPKMFSKTGSIVGLDNISAVEMNNELSDATTVGEDGNGYADRDWIIEAISDEMLGKGARTPEEIAADQHAEEVGNLLDALNYMGLDIESANNQQVRDALTKYEQEQRDSLYGGMDDPYADMGDVMAEPAPDPSVIDVDGQEVKVDQRTIAKVEELEKPEETFEPEEKPAPIDEQPTEPDPVPEPQPEPVSTGVPEKYARIEKTYQDVVRLVALKGSDRLSAADGLIPIIGNLDNKLSREAFAELTGKALPKTVKGTKEAVDTWAGLTEDDLLKREEKEAVRKRESTEKRLERDIAYEGAKLSRVKVQGAGTLKEYLDDMIGRGFNSLVSRKDGAATAYFLANTEGAGYPLKFKGTSGAPLRYVRAVLELTALRQADMGKVKETAPAPEPQDHIADFGEKIGGARKDVWQDYGKRMTDALPDDLKLITLSKHFPEPDYEGLIGQGIDVNVLAAIKAMRDLIPSKPRQEWKLREWVKVVTAFRDHAAKMIDGTVSPASVLEIARSGKDRHTYAQLEDKIVLYMELGYPSFTRAANYSLRSGYYSVHDGIKYPENVYKVEVRKGYNRLKSFDTRAEAVEWLRAQLSVEPDETKTDRSVKLDIYQYTKTGEIVIGKIMGRGKQIDLKGGFKDRREAIQFLKDNEKALLVLLEKRKDIPPERRSVNDPRKGEDYRRGDDVTAEKFAAEFGFRGVEFGNYVEQKRRAEDLNNAYDALMDMARIINVPSRAVSLNGSLGLAFGARGKGGKNAAAAHYEPDFKAINLTKTGGKGSLGHEWWHALDNFFGAKQQGRTYLTADPSLRKLDKDGKPIAEPPIRPEVVEAFKGIMTAIKKTEMPKRSLELDKTRTKNYWSTDIEMSARAFEAYLIHKAAQKGESNDYLANVTGKDAWEALVAGGDSYPYPNAQEMTEIIAPAFDNLFATLKTKETEIKSNNVAVRPTGMPVGGYYAIDAETGDIIRGKDWKPGDMPRRFDTEEKAVAWGQTQSVRKGVTLYQFAGKDSKTADLEALKVAQQRLARMESIEKVRKETGWFLGYDKKWRYEISDNDAVMKRAIKEGETTTLGDILEHPKLYAAYPFLKDVTIGGRILAGSTEGLVARGIMGPRIEINTVKPSQRSADLQKSTVMHEIQHLIQHFEGFASGGNPDQLGNIEKQEVEKKLEQASQMYQIAVKEKDKEKLDQAVKQLEQLPVKGLSREDKFRLYTRLYGEIEARNTSTRIDYTEFDRKEVSPERSQDVDNSQAIVVFSDGTEVTSSRDVRRTLNQTDQGGKPRGSISFLPDGRAVINLFQDEDLSTVLHEFGHLYWKALTEIAALENPPESIVRDVKTVRAWAGASPDDLTIPLTVEQEEKIADGFLSYLREGKAPSVELQGAFSRFKRWMTRLYKGVRDTLPTITPEVRDVFDRMLATEEEINRLSKAPEFSIDAAILNFLPKAEQERYRKKVEGMIERAKERLLKKALAEAERKYTKEYREAEAESRRLATAQVNTEQVYQAIDQILKAGGLDKDWLTKNFGKEVFKYLTLHGQGMVAKKGGLPAHMIAGATGYKDVREFIGAIMNAPRKAERIATVAQETLDRQYGDMIRDQTIGEQAMQAYHNGIREEVLAIETKVLADLAGIPAPTPDAIKAKAIQIMAETKVGEISAERRLRSEKSAYFKYGKALGQKQYAKAARHKAQQLLNHHLYRMSLEADEMVGKRLEQWRRLSRRKDEKAGKAIDIDYVYAARAVLAKYGVVSEDGYNFKAWIDQLTRENPELAETLQTAISMQTEDIPAWTSRQNVRGVTTRTPPFKQMGYADFRALADAVDNLIETGRNQRQITVEGKKLAVQDAVDNLNGVINTMKPSGISSGYGGKLTTKDIAAQKLFGAKAWTRRVNHWVRSMDGGQYTGFFRTYFWNRVIDATGAYKDRRQSEMKKFTETIAPFRDDLHASGPIAAPELVSSKTGESYVFEDLGEVLGMMLHTGNESNLYKLIAGMGWGEINEDGDPDTEPLQSFLRRMEAEGRITRAHWELVQAMWDQLETLKPEVWKAHKEMYGFRPDEVTASPVHTSYGEFKGGYWPAIVDRSKSKDAEIRQAVSAVQSANNQYAFPTTGRGATRTRVESYAAPLEFSLRLLPSHVDWAVRFVHIEPAIKDVMKIVMNKDFRASMDAVDPAVIDEMIVPWLSRVGRQTTELPVGGGKTMRDINKAAAYLRRQTGLQMMMGNVINILQQATGIAPLMRKTGYHNFSRQFLAYFSNPRLAAQRVNGQSAVMRHQQTMFEEDYQRRLERILEKRNKFQKVQDFQEDYGYIGQRIFQHSINNIGWMAAYNQALAGDAKGVPADNIDAAVRYADEIVAETQGFNSAEYVSASEVTTHMGKLFLLFYSYFNNQGNMLINEGQDIRRSGRSRGGKAAAALHLYLMAYMIPSFVADVIGATLRGALPDDDDDDGTALDDWFQFFAISQVRYLNAMLPYAREVGSFVIGKFTDMPYDDQIAGSPAFSVLERALSFPFSVYNAVFGNGDASKAMKDTLTAVGLTGVPVGFVQRPVTYAVDLAEGDSKVPDGAIPATLEVGRGVLAGPAVGGGNSGGK